MINNRQLADAILARMPDGVTSFEIARKTDGPFDPHWRVTMHDDAMLACHECVSQTDPLFSTALAKANVSLLRKRAEIARRDGIALAYSADWSATALQCEREERN
jgi:hypothetical protein